MGHRGRTAVYRRRPDQARQLRPVPADQPRGHRGGPGGQPGQAGQPAHQPAGLVRQEQRRQLHRGPVQPGLHRRPVAANWSDLGITGQASVRDLWSQRNLGSHHRELLGATLPAHGSRLLRITPDNASANNPAMPANLHGTASTASSVSLAWDPSQANGHAASGYTVYVDGKKTASASQPSVTLSGLAPATTYQLRVAADGLGGRTSALSQTLTLTTPAASGPATYEAESSANTIGGGAAVCSCSGCSGGAKVGYLGGTGYLTFNDVVAPRRGHLPHAGFLRGRRLQPAGSGHGQRHIVVRPAAARNRRQQLGRVRRRPPSPSSSTPATTPSSSVTPPPTSTTSTRSRSDRPHLTGARPPARAGGRSVSGRP